MGEVLRTIGDMLGVRGLGTPRGRYLEGCGTLQNEFREDIRFGNGFGVKKGIESAVAGRPTGSDRVSSLHFVPKAVGSHVGSSGGDRTA